MQSPDSVQLAPYPTGSAKTPPSARAWALKALCTEDPGEKVHQTHALFAALLPGSHPRAVITSAETLAAPTDHPLPGRPARPALIPPMQVPHRSPFTPEGLAALVHAICHIEFNAIKTPFNDSELTIIKFHCDPV